MFGKVTLLVFSTLISLLTLEGITRLFNLAPQVIAVSEGRYQLSSNPLLGYEPTPALNYSGDELYNYDWKGEVTELGFRGRNFPRKKSAGERRIAVLGDSISAGLWIDRYEDSFPGVIQSNLPTAQLLNFGLVGYNTRQEVESLKEFGLQYSPDIVLLQYCLNDRERNDGALLSRLLEKEKSATSGVSPILTQSILANSALYRLITFKVLPLLGLEPLRPGQEERYHALATDSVEDALNELGALARIHSFRGVVAIFPHLNDLDNYQFSSEHLKIRFAAESAGLEVIDLLEPFKRCRETLNDTLRLDEYHPNVTGHRCAGEFLASKLSEILQRDFTED